MRAAIRLSLSKMRANCGGPFGAVVVRKGKIVGRGWNQVTSSNDPTAHAEVTAIRDACSHLQTFQHADCELYTTCEPCPMCLSAIYWARIPTIYFGNTREDATAIGFDDDFIYQQVALPPAQRTLRMKPLLREEAQGSFRRWTALENKVRY